MTFLRTYISDNCRPIIGHAYKTTSHRLRAFDKFSIYCSKRVVGKADCDGMMNLNEFRMQQDPEKYAKMPKFCDFIQTAFSWPIIIRNSDHSTKTNFYPKFGLGLQKPLFPFFLCFPRCGPSLWLVSSDSESRQQSTTAEGSNHGIFPKSETRQISLLFLTSLRVFIWAGLSVRIRFLSFLEGFNGVWVGYFLRLSLVSWIAQGPLESSFDRWCRSAQNT